MKKNEFMHKKEEEEENLKFHFMSHSDKKFKMWQRRG